MGSTKSFMVGNVLDNGETTVVYADRSPVGMEEGSLVNGIHLSRFWDGFSLIVLAKRVGKS